MKRKYLQWRKKNNLVYKENLNHLLYKILFKSVRPYVHNYRVSGIQFISAYKKNYFNCTTGRIMTHFP